MEKEVNKLIQVSWNSTAFQVKWTPGSRRTTPITFSSRAVFSVTLTEGSIGIFGFAVLDIFLIGFSVFVSKDVGFSVLVFNAVCGFFVFKHLVFGFRKKYKRFLVFPIFSLFGPIWVYSFVRGFRFWPILFAVLRFWTNFSSVLRFLVYPNAPLLTGEELTDLLGVSKGVQGSSWSQSQDKHLKSF